MRFLIDADLPRSTKPLLEKYGHEAGDVRDIGKLVEHRVARDGEEGYSAEVFNAVGDTLAVITVPDPALEALREDEVCCVRSLA